MNQSKFGVFFASNYFNNVSFVQSDERIQDLQNKLLRVQHGKYESMDKLQKAKFYQNLTKEQYTGTDSAANSTVSMLSVSRDSLNPKLNAQTLQRRLAVIEHYRYRFGVEQAHWPHFMMGRTFNALWKYKFNYAVKGMAALALFSAVQDFRNVNSKAFLTYDQAAVYHMKIATQAAVFAGVCAII